MNALRIFDPRVHTFETLLRCPLCGTLGIQQSWQRDRYGYLVGVGMCECGLDFLNPRMDRYGYREFYRSGAYRQLVSAWHGREINAGTLQPEQNLYGAELVGFLKKHNAPHKTVLDVGGSTGEVARVVSRALGAKATVLDPAPEELAQASGLETIPASIEDYEPAGRKWSLILLCQTADHLLDISGTLRKIREALSPGGMFWVDIVDFEVTREVKIDHPFNLTKATMEQFLDRAQFDVVAVRPEGYHVGYLCK